MVKVNIVTYVTLGITQRIRGIMFLQRCVEEYKRASKFSLLVALDR